MFSHFPVIFLTLFLARILCTGASLGDALALAALSGMYAFHLFLQSKKQIPINKDILDRIVYLEEQLTDTKSKVSGVLLSQSQRR